MVYFNGNYYDTGSLPIDTSNRAFKYGDGVFESILIHEGNIPLLSYHLRRMTSGLKLIGIDILPHWDDAFFHSLLNELVTMHGLPSARAKVTVWRAGEGLYLPVSDAPELLIEIFPIPAHPFSISLTPLHLGIYTESQRPINPLSACKTLNALPYVLAARYAQRNGFDDALVLNTQGEIADAVSSNVWIAHDRNLTTTPVDNGGVAGTMQQWLCDHARELGYTVTRSPLGPDDLLHAQAVFLTNAIQGIRPVTQFKTRTFDNNLPESLLEKIRTSMFV